MYVTTERLVLGRFVYTKSISTMLLERWKYPVSSAAPYMQSSRNLGSSAQHHWNITIFMLNPISFSRHFVGAIAKPASYGIILCALLTTGCQQANSANNIPTEGTTLNNSAALSDTNTPGVSAAMPSSSAQDDSSQIQATAPTPQAPAPRTPAAQAPTPAPNSAEPAKPSKAVNASPDGLAAGQKTLTYYEARGWDVMVAAFEPWSGEQNAGNFTLKAMKVELSGETVELTDSIDLGNGKITCDLGTCSTVWQDGNVSYVLVEETSLEARFSNGPTDTARFLIFVGDHQVNQTVELQQERYPNP